MKTIVAILAILVFSCTTSKEPSEYKFISIEFIRLDTAKRWIDNRDVEQVYYLYKDNNGEMYRLPVNYGWHGQFLVRK